ncbi:hypothetical protein KUA25_06165 [Bacteroidales bacterium MSK.15.36]|nr:hypothetical protein [Bacteroidales bacterium MSK.15.36]
MSLKVNGKAYDWGDVDLKIPNLTIEIQEISYDDELEKELVYGKGQAPRGYGEGNYKPSGKMSLLRDDYDEIVEYCKRKGVPFYKLQIPKIIVSYANAGAKTISDVLNKVSFGKASHKAAQGDKSLKVDIDLFIAGTIDRNGLKPV